MDTFISMLRGINVSGQNRIRMEDLKNIYADLGLVNISTYVQSGNVVFDSEEQTPSILANQIEAQIEKSFGLPVPVLIRTPVEFKRILLHNPFYHGRDTNPASLHVTFLISSPSVEKLDNLKMPGDGDEFSAGEQEIFLLCSNGYGRTKLNNAYFERILGLSATTRNWKTVNALYDISKRREV